MERLTTRSVFPAIDDDKERLLSKDIRQPEGFQTNTAENIKPDWDAVKNQGPNLARCYRTTALNLCLSRENLTPKSQLPVNHDR